MAVQTVVAPTRDDLQSLRQRQALCYHAGGLAHAAHLAWTPGEYAEWVFLARRRVRLWETPVRRWGWGNPWVLASSYRCWAHFVTGVVHACSTRHTVSIRHPALTDASRPLLVRFQLGPSDSIAFWTRFGQLAGAEVGVECAWECTEETVQVQFSSAGGEVCSPDQDGPPLMTSSEQAQFTVAHELGAFLGAAMARGHAPEQAARFLIHRALPGGFGRRRSIARPTTVAEFTAVACRQHLALSDQVQVRVVGKGRLVQARPFSAEVRAILGIYGVLPAHIARLYNGILQELASDHSVMVFCEAGEQTFQTELRRRAGSLAG